MSQTSAQIIDGTRIPDAMASTNKYASAEFFEFLWRTSGILYVVFFIVIAVIYGYQPGVGASPDALAAFYGGNRTWILAASALSAFNLLNLLWFAMALKATLTDTGQDGWGGAAIAAGAMFGGLSIVTFSIGAVLAFSVGGPGNPALASALNDLMWALVVLTSFPRAMLIMSGVFGFWRSGQISNGLFTLGVLGVVLGVVGGFAWLSGGGPLSPDGMYSRFVSPALLLVWTLFVTRVLLSKSRAAGAGW